MREDTKNVRGLNLHFLELLKTFLDLILLGYWLNRLIILRGCSIDAWKKSKSKNTMKLVRIWRKWRILIFFVPSWISASLNFFFIKKVDLIWLGYWLDRLITLRRCSIDAWKNKNKKILKKSQGYKECEESSHSSYPPKSPFLWTFFLFKKNGPHMAWILIK